MYVLAKNKTVIKFPYSLSDLRQDNPNTSFPSAMSDADLADYNVFPVLNTNFVFNPDTEKYFMDGCVFNENTQRWETNWVVTSLNEEELLQKTEDKKNEIRRTRNQLLIESDWTQGKDIDDAVSSIWATYREALRNVPNQPGFPWDVQWPTKPE